MRIFFPKYLAYGALNVAGVYPMGSGTVLQRIDTLHPELQDQVVDFAQYFNTQYFVTGTLHENWDVYSLARLGAF
jgi:hypothetical protein